MLLLEYFSQRFFCSFLLSLRTFFHFSLFFCRRYCHRRHVPSAANHLCTFAIYIIATEAASLSYTLIGVDLDIGTRGNVLLMTHQTLAITRRPELYSN